MIARLMSKIRSNDAHIYTRIMKAANRIFSRNFHHATVLSPCKLPQTGPAIVVSNHISSVDPFLIQGTSHRVIRWLMAKEYFDLPVVRTLCGHLGFIPVIRTGKDAASLKAALRTLEAGGVLGIFPEGTFSKTQDLLPFQNGVGMIALRTGAPVYPVAIEKIPRDLSVLAALTVPRSAKIFWGSLLTPSGDSAACTAVFRKEVQTLQQQTLATNHVG